ncbi:MAG: hypothetical protein QXZ44_01310 [Ferroplasma sp.]
MEKYSIFLISGIFILSATYAVVFSIPGSILVRYMNNSIYSGIIPRVLPVFLIFGDVFIVIPLLFPMKNYRRNRDFLFIASIIFIMAGTAIAGIIHVSPLSSVNYNGLRSGYLIITGASMLFFTVVISHYLVASYNNIDSEKLEF